MSYEEVNALAKEYLGLEYSTNKSIANNDDDFHIAPKCH